MHDLQGVLQQVVQVAQLLPVRAAALLQEAVCPVQCGVHLAELVLQPSLLKLLQLPLHLRPKEHVH
eukprot:CAMPEP_0179117984 /NCGR_PEP_ID=MMETSP0796-20121207/55451_1 /TAXON_ID=73915 /ORGANISM="Pyrodinium bahamense, Strain pbaha01" /LENGTH=65 /DNA_ID=CAMNT_0020816391 /DNA_START=84 /DNA_END=278 /DNA_ORIENTATION=-